MRRRKGKHYRAEARGPAGTTQSDESDVDHGFHAGQPGEREELPYVREAAGAREVHLAASVELHGFPDAGAVVDAAGRHRLATLGAQLRATDGRVSKIVLFFLFVFISK
jgi:hypothetical protein